MKTVVLVNQKGGVGKSMVSSQLAYYAAATLNKRVLFIDVDHQMNSSKAIRVSQKATISSITSSKLFFDKVVSVETSSFTLIPGDEALKQMEKQPDKHNLFATNFRSFLHAVKDQYDYCFIDTNPNPDIRVTSALVSADYVLAPVQLNQEAIDGIKGVLHNIETVKKALNPKLMFIGILPNQVQATPFQKNNFAQIAGLYASRLIKTDAASNAFAHIPDTTAIAEAQAGGLALWEMKKTSAREAWRKIKPFFEKIFDIMEAEGGTAHA